MSQNQKKRLLFDKLHSIKIKMKDRNSYGKQVTAGKFRSTGCVKVDGNNRGNVVLVRSPQRVLDLIA